MSTLFQVDVVQRGVEALGEVGRLEGPTRQQGAVEVLGAVPCVGVHCGVVFSAVGLGFGRRGDCQNRKRKNVGGL